MIFESQPKDFKPKFDVVSCFASYEGKILLLYRLDHKPDGRSWGIPTGKIDDGESQIEAMIREFREETGVSLSESDFIFMTTFYVRYEEMDFIYHLYKTAFSSKPNIKINPKEHKNYMFKLPQDSLDYPLVRDLDECVQFYIKHEGLSEY